MRMHVSEKLGVEPEILVIHLTMIGFVITGVAITVIASAQQRAALFFVSHFACRQRLRQKGRKETRRVFFRGEDFVVATCAALLQKEVLVGGRERKEGGVACGFVVGQGSQGEWKMGRGNPEAAAWVKGTWTGVNGTWSRRRKERTLAA